jgi:Ca-activated chloride channel family protein
VTAHAPNSPQEAWRYAPPVDREQYEHLAENDFLEAIKNPLSTFSIDVDVASYANMRRYVTRGHMPPPAAVRIEEFINYFDYDYPQPTGRDPFAVVTETARCPWNPEHRLVHIGLQGREMERTKAPPSNLVFLVDVSGSMSSPDKLRLIKDALPMLVAQLRRTDRVALVVYAGAAGVVLESTPGDEKNTILEAIRRLESGGSTAGGAGIRLAYDIAEKNFIKKGNNRVILATDGDFNVGVTSDGELVKLIEEKRETGVFLTVLGVGTGNLQDARMEKIADHGNGNYAYLDNLAEAQKVLVNEMFGTIVTIAKDVKIQVEFNPLKVASYRLIGYENRMLKKEDFRDDRKDAGELGAGHTVTALYEITPADGSEQGEELTFTRTQVKADARSRDELLIVRLRYKQPDGTKSTEIVHTAEDTDAAFDDSSENFRFAAAVAEFGMILRGSSHAGAANLDQVVEVARRASGEDLNGYRAEFVDLAERCKEMQPTVSNKQ